MLKKNHICFCFVVAFIDSGPANETKATWKKWKNANWMDKPQNRIGAFHWWLCVERVAARNRRPARIFCGHFSIIFVCSDKMVANWTWYGSSGGRVRGRKRPAAAAFDRTEPSHCLVAVITDSRFVTAILFVLVFDTRKCPVRWDEMEWEIEKEKMSVQWFFFSFADRSVSRLHFRFGEAESRFSAFTAQWEWTNAKSWSWCEIVKSTF